MILLIDGRSGSGKTTFAAKLHDVLGWPVVHLEDAYPGWAGLAAASEAVAESMLNPAVAGFRRWDWYASDRAEWVDLTGVTERSLIIEGCGAVTAANLAAARALGDGEAWGAWVELDEPTRRARAMARDPHFRGHWDMWAAQEDAHIDRHDPVAVADWIVAGCGG